MMRVSALLNPLRCAFPRYVGQSPEAAWTPWERESNTKVLAASITNASSMKAIFRLLLKKHCMVGAAFQIHEESFMCSVNVTL